MPKRSFFLLISLALGLHLGAQEMDRHLFILTGQSNMVGLKPEQTFIPAVQKAFGESQVIVIKLAVNGQPILRWYNHWESSTGVQPERTGDLYDLLMDKVYPAIEGQHLASVTVVWMQGERDTKNSTYVDVYGDGLKGLYEQFSRDLGREDINFVIGRLSDHRLQSANWVKVRECQVALAEANPRWAWVDTDDLNDGILRKGVLINNDLHYSPEGYKVLGERFAEKAIALIKASGQK